MLVTTALASDNPRHGQKRFELLSTTTWAAAGTTTAVRCGKGLVQVEMDDINAHITGPRHPYQRVHVCAIHVNQAARVMYDLADLLNVCFEETKCVRVR